HLRSLHSFPTRRSSDLRSLCIVFLCSLNVIFYSFFLKDVSKDVLEIQTNSSLRGWLFLAFISSVVANYMAAMAIRSSNATLAAADRKSTRLNSSHDQIS